MCFEDYYLKIIVYWDFVDFSVFCLKRFFYFWIFEIGDVFIFIDYIVRIGVFRLDVNLIYVGVCRGLIILYIVFCMCCLC